MKKFYLLTTLALLALPCSAQAALVAGWDTWNNTGANQTTGVTAERGAFVPLVGFNLSADAASDDATFGSLPSPAANASSTNLQDGTILANGADGSIDFTITENVGTAIDFETFHFDYTRFRFGSAENYSLEILAGGSLTSGVVGVPGTVGVYNTDKNLPDFDIDLTGLADSQLGVGESVTFRLAFTGGNGAAGQHVYVDNVGVSGTVVAVPEPSSLALLGLAGSVVMVRRRKK